MPRKPILDGRELSKDELARIRREIEAFDTIERDGISDEMYALIAEQWPYLLHKLRPARSI